MNYINRKRRAYVLVAFTLAYSLLALAVWIWLVSSGALLSAGKDILGFFTTDIEVTALVIPEWMHPEILISFGALMFLCSMAAFMAASFIKGQMPKNHVVELLKKPPHELLYLLMGVTFIEEAIFRFLLIGVGGSLWQGEIALLVLVIGSSIIFGAAHLFNFKKDERSIAFVIPQMLSGVILAYFFLTYGFFAAWALHFVFNAALIVPAYSKLAAYSLLEEEDNEEDIENNTLW